MFVIKLILYFRVQVFTANNTKVSQIFTCSATSEFHNKVKIQTKVKYLLFHVKTIKKNQVLVKRHNKINDVQQNYMFLHKDITDLIIKESSVRLYFLEIHVYLYRQHVLQSVFICDFQSDEK